MISDEVRMLLNRMETNPDEFIADRPSASKWSPLMSSLLGNRPDLEFMFEPEELKALRVCVKHMMQKHVRANIVKQIVGGEEEAQKELDLADSVVYKKRTITQADLLKMKAFK